MILKKVDTSHQIRVASLAYDANLFFRFGVKPGTVFVAKLFNTLQNKLVDTTIKK